MKHSSIGYWVVAFALVAGSAFAEERFEDVTIDWSNPETLQRTVVLQCDESKQEGADILVPGRPVADFAISLDADTTLSNGCAVIGRKTEGNNTLLRVRGDENCQISILNTKTHQVAKIGFESC